MVWDSMGFDYTYYIYVTYVYMYTLSHIPILHSCGVRATEIGSQWLARESGTPDNFDFLIWLCNIKSTSTMGYFGLMCGCGNIWKLWMMVLGLYENMAATSTRHVTDCCTDEKGKRTLETETKNGFHYVHHFAYIWRCRTFYIGWLTFWNSGYLNECWTVEWVMCFVVRALCSVLTY